MALHVAITGSTGFIGEALVSRLKREGFIVTRFLRPGPKRVFNEICGEWDPRQGMIDVRTLENQDAVIHLAGAGIAGGRWTASYRRNILQSRIEGTRLLSTTIANLARKPKVLLCASAVGFYGNCPPGRTLDEDSTKGQGFLADVCEAWEAAVSPAHNAGVRVVTMRMGMVLGLSGGALPKMLPAFLWGLGGPLGSGRQMMNWVALEDVAGIALHAIQNDSLRGPINVVSPCPVSNRDFTKILARVIQRPAFFKVPAFAIRTIFGQMGEELLLTGAAVHPRRLLDSGYRFQYPDLEQALIALFQRKSLAHKV